MKRQKTMGHAWLATPVLMAMTTGLIGAAAHAQPDGVPKAENPPVAPPPQGGPRPDWQNMTPEQRDAMMQQRQERRLRRDLTEAGFTDKVLQDTLVSFRKDQDKARRLLQDQFRKIGEALRDKAITDPQLAALLTDFRADIAAEKDRRDAALKVLDQKIGYSTKPRLDAFLMIQGFTGDEMSIVGPSGGNGGGFGGGFGGGGFGGGGFGGGGNGGGFGGNGGNGGNGGGNNPQK